MSQPVKLSDNLVLDARLTGQVAERSIAGQIEFWAGLGRSLEWLMRGHEVLALRKSGGLRSLSACLAGADSPAGRRRVADLLKTRPGPRYEASTEQPGLLVRTDPDGKRILGRFVNRQFETVRVLGKK